MEIQIKNQPVRTKYLTLKKADSAWRYRLVDNSDGTVSLYVLESDDTAHWDRTVDSEEAQDHFDEIWNMGFRIESCF